MAVFFALLGITMGVYTGRLLGKETALADTSTAIAAIVTINCMYIGEMILLSGNLYRFGSGSCLRIRNVVGTYRYSRHIASV